MARDNFSENTKQILAKRVNYFCSNPTCKRPTCGPHTEYDKSINIGEASHICAADSGGKRYDPNMTKEERSSPHNGIWLCRKCGKLIDSDEKRYTVELLHKWKNKAESAALQDIEGIINSFNKEGPQIYDNILIKYSSIWSKNIIFLSIANKESYAIWQGKTIDEQKIFLYESFYPYQFLILGAKLYRGTIRYKVDNNNYILLGTIEMPHCALFEESSIRIFNDYSFACSIEADEKEFAGHIG